jgi:xanthine dehydrogenase YagR molybdenum-binding subunit
VPVHADTPAIEGHFHDGLDLNANPIGAKGLGELGITGSGTVVLNAIYNACGVRTRSVPLTLDKILKGLG